MNEEERLWLKNKMAYFLPSHFPIRWLLLNFKWILLLCLLEIPLLIHNLIYNLSLLVYENFRSILALCCLNILGYKLYRITKSTLKVFFLWISKHFSFQELRRQKFINRSWKYKIEIDIISITLDKRKCIMTHIKYVKLKLKRCFYEILMKVFFKNFTASKGRNEFYIRRWFQ